MKRDGGLSFETQLKIEFLPPNNGSKKCLEKSLLAGLFAMLTESSQSNFYFILLCCLKCDGTARYLQYLKGMMGYR